MWLQMTNDTLLLHDLKPPFQAIATTSSQPTIPIIDTIASSSVCIVNTTRVDEMVKWQQHFTTKRKLWPIKQNQLGGMFNIEIYDTIASLFFTDSENIYIIPHYLVHYYINSHQRTCLSETVNVFLWRYVKHVMTLTSWVVTFATK